MATKTAATKNPPALNQPPTPPRVGILNEIAVDDIAAWDGNPRRSIAADELAELTDSIRNFGVIMPIAVRPNPNRHPPYILIAGERRWRAAAIAELEFIPALIYEDIDETEALELAVAENLKRIGINPMEEAEALWRLAEAGQTQSAIAARLGLSQPWIANRLRLRLLSEPTKELIAEGKLSAAHGIALASYSGLPLESWLATWAVRNSSSTHDLERDKVNRLLYQTPNTIAINLTESDVGAIQYGICKQKCPYGAYRHGNGTSYCLQPAHRQELVTARQEVASTARATAIAEATAATGQEPPTLANANRSELTQIHQPPSGCTAACPCRTRAVGYGGDLVDACSAPKRLDKLRDEDRADELAIQRARYAARIQRVDDWMKERVLGDPEVLALLLVDRCDWLNEHLEAIADELGLEITWRVEKGYGVHPNLLAQLNKLGRNTLIEIAGRATLRGSSPAVEQWNKLHPAPPDPTP